MARLRKGMWATFEGEIGIINDFRNEDGAVEFHKVDANGETTIVVFADPLAVAQAAVNDIPALRRPDEMTARKFGYA